MTAPNPTETPFVSIFETAYDSIVCGGGFIGFAAAESLAAKGKRVLLVEASGDLLWESTRALENPVSGSQPSKSWETWLQPLRERRGADEDWFDPALAEILTAKSLQASDAPFQVLLYAAPVAVEQLDGGLARLTVATKAGPRALRAAHWVDATEEGVLARLCDPQLSVRKPQHSFRNLVLEGVQPESFASVWDALVSRHPGLEYFRSHRSEECRLRWTETVGPWYRKALAVVQDMRELISGGPGADFCVSHCAMHVFSTYGETEDACPSSSLPGNLHLLSPVLVGQSLQSPADRYTLGASISDQINASAGEALTDEPAVPVAEWPEALDIGEAYDVVVAGVGTAGALAALAAGRQGARTLAFDHSTYPGGVGTGGGINGYFHGVSGGLQDEVDQRTREISQCFTGRPSGLNGWHHEAKKIALLEMFESAGVDFRGDVWLGDVERDSSGWVSAVYTVLNGRWIRIPGCGFVDGTGDGDLCVRAGAAFVCGREGDGRTLAYSQSAFSLAGNADGPVVRSCNFDAGWVDPTDPEDLTRARLQGIAQHLHTQATREGNCLSLSPLIGLRQSRQIQTSRVLAFDDIVEGRRFADAIGVTKGVADTHSVDFEFESDGLAFYYWTCRGFRVTLKCDLPYGMLLPEGLQNVWVPCRAAGLEVSAAYGMRMQRDMQRLGEAAGVAAALASTTHAGSREIDLATLQAALRKSGALSDTPEASESTADANDWLEALDEGKPGIHLWHLSRDSAAYREAVLKRLNAPTPNTSFYAAAILAQWGDFRAEPRLIRAVNERERGPSPKDYPVSGAHGQCIDIPFWLQAVVLLRQVGGDECLDALHALAAEAALPYNVKTTLAMTLERLAVSTRKHEAFQPMLELLERHLGDSVLPPSFSLWHILYGEPQKKLKSDYGTDTAQDQRWQLELVLTRVRRRLGIPVHASSSQKYSQDQRALVREAFSAAQS